MNLTPNAQLLATAFIVGLGVATAPGPVQALVVVEAVRDGFRGGVIATAGAALSFWLLLVLLATGLSLAAPSADAARVLQGLGGLVVLWIAADSFRNARLGLPGPGGDRRNELGHGFLAAGRVALAVVIFPGTWIFLAAIATPLLASARVEGGPLLALLVTIGLVLGTSSGNLGVAMLAAWGSRVASARLVVRLRQVASVALGLIGLVLVGSAIASGSG
ncbi:MAG TPA: LysE family transporter [Chloroflexota bacterium]|nr:LysE family transporter [Chloroflexota bacterium]